MDSEHIFGESDGDHFVGEIRSKNGLPSMCLGRRHYGGGIGYVWATQTEAAEFSLMGLNRGYLYGLCQSVDPKKKSISMLIVRGLSWGDFATGAVAEIPAQSIDRFHKPYPMDQISLVDWSKKIDLDVSSSEAFLNISAKELEAAFKASFKEDSKLLLGDKAYERSFSLFQAYMNFLDVLRNSKGNFRQQPSKKLLSSARQVRVILGMEGTRFSWGNGQIFPSNLSAKSSAAYGAVCGAMAGDAAGGVLEFLGRRPERSEVDRALNMPGGGVFDLAPGQITDDGELTLCLLRSMANLDGDYDIETVARSYIDWAQSGPFDIGQATSNALRISGSELNGAAKSASLAAALHNQNSKANGALMRASPLGVVTVGLSEQVAVRIAMEDANLTHPNKTCLEANAAYVLAIRHLILNPGDRAGALASAQRFLQGTGSEVAGWLEEAIDGNLPLAWPFAGFVRIAFTYAFFHLNQGSSYRSAISDTLLRGGDTDTNACIVGGLIGAYRGINNLLTSEATRKIIFPVMMCDPTLGQDRPDIYHASTVPLLLGRLVEALEFD
jgi:ADP-ribosylglycohydrolase